MQPKFISSRQNALVKQLYRLSQTPSSYQQLEQIWLEGEHLCHAYQNKMGAAKAVVYSQSGYEKQQLAYLGASAQEVYVLSDMLFEQISGLKSAAGIGYLVEPETMKSEVAPYMPTVVLDRLQDPGNIGSILRSAAAFGFEQIIALKGSCGLWAPKVLRAGMGAHFSLQLHEQCSLEQLQHLLKLPLLGTSSHAEKSLQRLQLPWPCAWVVGHEGQGISAELLQHCNQIVRIDQPGGEESFNAAVAASICMYESSKQVIHKQ